MNTNPNIQKTKFFQFLRQRACEKQKLKKFCFLDIWRRYQKRPRVKVFSRFWCIYCLILPFLDKFQVFLDILYIYYVIFKFFKNFGGFSTNFRGFFTFLIIFFHYFDRFLHKWMFQTFYIYFPDFLVISEGFLTDLKFLKIFFYFSYLSINIHLSI